MVIKVYSIFLATLAGAAGFEGLYAAMYAYVCQVYAAMYDTRVKRQDQVCQGTHCSHQHFLLLSVP